MKTNKLNKILRKHEMWLKYEEGGVCADLSFCDLSNTNLCGAELHGANLDGADLRNTDLAGADLSSAGLYRADLSGAHLSGANLCYADLSGANLDGAHLCYANLYRANLKHANLHGADLRHANLHRADLDFSCLPLWCGSLSAHFDDKQLKQIAYHLVKAGLQSENASEETKAELAKLIDFANGFHRVDECGKIESEVTK